MRAATSIAMKDIRLLCRDRLDLFFTFIFPLFVALFFGTIFGGAGGGGGSKIGIAAVDEDGTAASAAFISRLAESREFRVQSTDEAGTPLTREAGNDLVRRGKRVACIVLPKGFGASAGAVFSGQPIRIEGTVDPSRRAESGMIQGILMQHAFQSLAESLGDQERMRGMVRESLDRVRTSDGMDPAMRGALEQFLPSVDRFFTDAPRGGDGDGASGGLGGWMPITIDLAAVAGPDDRGRVLPPSSFAVSFPQAVIWGILGCVMSFAISLTSERSGGTLVRLLLAPIGRGQVLAGKALGCFSICIAVTLGVLIFGRVMGVAWRDPAKLAVGILCIATGFVGVMMLIATMSRTAGGAGGMGRAILLVLAMVGGGSIPLFFMPEWMQTASSISPFKWAIQVLEAGLWRPLSWGEFAVPCAVLLGFGVVGFALGARRFAWTERG